MAYFPQVGANGMTVQLPFGQTFSHLTSVSELQAGPRQSYAWRPNPMMAWDLNYPALTPAEYATLLSFFQSQQGRYCEFTFLDPGGNLVPASENFADASWQQFSVAVGASVAGPFSGSLGTTITGTTNGMLAAVVLPSGNGAGLWLCGSVYVLAPSASSLVIGFIDSGFNVLASQSCALSANQWTRIACTTQLATNSANNLNESKYGDFVPLLYGTQWVDCPVIVSTGDANVAKFEVLVCYGQPQAIQQVVLNDTLMPCAVDVNGQTYPVSDKNFCWRTVNNGSRSGAPNLDTLFNGLGDPYGSYCALEIVVPVQLASSASAPRVRVLVNGPAVRIYRTISQVVVAGGYATATINAVDVVPPTWNSASNQFTISGTGITGIDGTFTGAMHNWSGGAPGTIQFATTAANGTYTGLTGLFQYEAFTTRPVWALLDVLLWCGWNIADINIPSLVAADAVCGQQVSYQDQYGHTQTKDRYKCSSVLRQRRCPPKSHWPNGRLNRPGARARPATTASESKRTLAAKSSDSRRMRLSAARARRSPWSLPPSTACRRVSRSTPD